MIFMIKTINGRIYYQKDSVIALFVNLTITFTTSVKDKEYAMDLLISSFPLRAQKNQGQIFPSIFAYCPSRSCKRFLAL